MVSSPFANGPPPPGELLDVSAPNVTFVERALLLVSKRRPKNQSSISVPRRPSEADNARARAPANHVFPRRQLRVRPLECCRFGLHYIGNGDGYRRRVPS